MSRLRIAVYGAGQSGINFVQNSNEYETVGFLDGDPALCGRTILGIAVLAPSDIDKLEVDAIVIASSRLNPEDEFFQELRQRRGVQVISPAKEKLSKMPFSTEISRQRALEISNFLCFSSHANRGITPGWGTLLGLYRDQSVIPWDNDLDFFAVGVKVDEIRLIIRQCESDTGFVFNESPTQDPSKLSFRVQAGEELEAWVSVDILKESGDHFVVPAPHVGSNKSVLVPKGWVVPLGTHEVGGIQLVNDPEAILTRLYGNSWIIPDPSYSFLDARAHLSQFVS